MALIEATASAAEGRLRFTFWYNRHMNHIHSIKKWVVYCKKCLEGAANELPRL